MISYAQNLEDVILQRVFDRDHGTFVDVGANDPVIDSATYAFYRRGWRGIAIEPLPFLHARAQAMRPEDVNVRALASDTDGEVDFYEVATSHGLSTLDPDNAAWLAAHGYKVRRTSMPALTLDTILGRHLAGRSIDVLTIDVEGAEPKVLAGIDLQRFRAAVVMIEAMAPIRQVDVSAPSEAVLRAAGYEPVYDDGLNRFFLAAEHAELKPRFRYPPNVFDRFQRSRELQLEADLAEARERIAELENMLMASRSRR
jgi:FkbM family methyltransferase